jgi:hypothetical protein
MTQSLGFNINEATKRHASVICSGRHGGAGSRSNEMGSVIGFCQSLTWRIRRYMKIRGLKLQMAIQLVAERNLTEAQIAERVGVSVRALLELMEHPIFLRRVEEVHRIRLNPAFLD